jgi:NAD(P)H dehydrogenase (quinone)
MSVPVVITGASGRLGRRVAELLLAADGSLPVVLVTRTPSAVAHLAAATVRRGDFDDDASLASAFAGADGGVLLLVSTDALGRRVDQHRRAIEAAVAAGISHVVYTSLSNPVPGNPVQVVTDAHRRTEEALVSLAPRWTILRNATYADALLPLWRAAALDGRLVTSQGSGRTAWIARDDCAAVAAAVLSDDGGRLHAGQVYDVTGPALMGAAELASALAAWSGRPVSVEAVDDEAMVAHLVTGPPALPDERARLVVTWHRAVREGWFVQHTDAVERLTGHPARSVADLLAAG